MLPLVRIKQLNILNTAGTLDTAIALESTLGGVAITGKNSTLTMETAGDVTLTADTAATDTITITNTQGNTATAIALESTVGGVTISAGDGIDLSTGTNKPIKVKHRPWCYRKCININGIFSFAVMVRGNHSTNWSNYDVDYC